MQIQKRQTPTEFIKNIPINQGGILLAPVLPIFSEIKREFRYAGELFSKTAAGLTP